MLVSGHETAIDQQDQLLRCQAPNEELRVELK